MIRQATAQDARGIQAIYAPIVSETAISFETHPPTVAEMAKRISAIADRYPWLVYVHETDVLGYAYAGEFRSRPAYRFTVETSVYIAEGARGQGIGVMLYTSLLAVLRLQGYRKAVAGMTLPNPASAALHERMGFRPVGAFPGVGFKFGQWHDVGFYELDLTPDSSEPPEPLTTAEAMLLDGWAAALRAGAL